MKREAAFTTKFRHWLKANPLKGPAAFELKQTTSSSLPFSSVAEHQIAALVAAASYEGIIHKISDQSREYKPFDIAYFRYSAAYVVIKYPGFFCLINIGRFTAEKASSVRKSLTALRAKEIADIVVPLCKKKAIE